VVKAFQYRIVLNREERTVVGGSATAQEQNAARSQYACDFTSVFAPELSGYVVKAAPVGNQVKIAVVKGRVQSATFAPINGYVQFTGVLFSKSERLFGKIDAMGFKILLGEEDRIRSRPASQVEHSCARG
jgi:hypothetical protein